MKNLKKFLAVVLVAGFAFAAPITSFAATSSNKTNTDTTSTGAKVTEASATVDGKAVTLTITAPTAAEAKAADEQAAKVTTIQNAKVFSVVDIARPAGITDEQLAKGVEVTIKVDGMKTGTNVVVLHQKDNGSWETLSAKAGDGTVTFTTTSFSPFAVVTGEPSGKTGEAAPIVAVIAVIGLCAVAFVGAKKYIA